jgi:hypothetical protein
MCWRTPEKKLLDDTRALWSGGSYKLRHVSHCRNGTPRDRPRLCLCSSSFLTVTLAYVSSNDPVFCTVCARRPEGRGWAPVEVMLRYYCLLSADIPVTKGREYHSRQSACRVWLFLLVVRSNWNLLLSIQLFIKIELSVVNTVSPVAVHVFMILVSTPEHHQDLFSSPTQERRGC